MTGIAIPADPAALAAYEDILRAAARDFADNAVSDNTERAYDAAWRSFTGFTAALGRSALPAEPQTVADYVAHLALQGRKAATIRSYLTAIAVRHRAAGHESPTEHGVVRSVTKGMRRALGVAPQKKDALLRDELLAAVAAIPEDLRGLRDRAVLLIGWAGAFRRSEIAAIDVADLGFAAEGVVVTVRRAKTDQEAVGVRVAIRRVADQVACPVRALEAWLAATAVAAGPVFRAIDRHGRLGDRLSGRAVAEIIEARAPGSNIGGHSLRAGFATSAARSGETEAAIMRHGRWQSVTVARGYIREGALWSDALGIL